MANAHEAPAQGAANRDAEINFPDLLLILNQNDVWGGVKSLRTAFRWVFLFTLMALAVLIPLSLAINATDYRAFNLVFLFALAIIGLYHALDPFKWLVFFGFGGVFNGLPNVQFDRLIPIPGREFQIPDFKLREFMEAGGQGVKFYWDVLVVVWLFFAMWFAVLSTIEVNSAAVWGFMAMLLILGIISIRWSMSRCQLWFKRICIGIIVSMTILWGAGTFLGPNFKFLAWVTPQAEEIYSASRETENALNKEEAGRLVKLQEKRMSAGLSAAEQLEWNKLQDKEDSRGLIEGIRTRLVTLSGVIKKDVRIKDLKPHTLVGLEDLPAGCYTFKTEGPVVMVSNEPQWLYADIRLNGKRPGERICISDLRRPVLSVAEGFPKNVGLPQTVTLSFTWAP